MKKFLALALAIIAVFCVLLFWNAEKNREPEALERILSAYYNAPAEGIAVLYDAAQPDTELGWETMLETYEKLYGPYLADDFRSAFFYGPQLHSLCAENDATCRISDLRIGSPEPGQLFDGTAYVLYSYEVDLLCTNDSGEEESITDIGSIRLNPNELVDSFRPNLTSILAFIRG